VTSRRRQDEPGSDMDSPARWTKPAADMYEELDPLSPGGMSQMVFVDVVLLLPADSPSRGPSGEADAPFRELRIPVVAPRYSISYAARGLATPRPLTHELFTRVFEEFGMTLDVVRITEVRGTAFTAEIVISAGMRMRLIDCRLGCIALALRHRRCHCPSWSIHGIAIAGTDPMGCET